MSRRCCGFRTGAALCWALLIALLCTTPALVVGQVVSTNLGTRFQTIEGWGTSGNVGAGSPTVAASERAAYRDLGLNIYRVGLSHQFLTPINNDYRVRVPLAGNTLEENVAKFNSFNVEEDAAITGNFANWLSQNALESERAKIVASVWSPPHWMKGPTGASQNFVGITQNYPTPWMAGDAPEINWLPPGHGDSIGGRLRTEDPVNLAEYGQYMAAAVTAYERHFGVDLYALSLQNESTFENPFSSMTFQYDEFGFPDFSQYALALASVRDAWIEHGLDTKIKGPHVASVGPTPGNPYTLNAQMGMIQGVKDYSDPTLIDFLDFYNANYYMDGNQAGVQATAGYYHGRDAVAAPWAAWFSAPGIANDGKPVWYSETGGEQSSWVTGPGGNSPGNGAITVAQRMFNAIVHSDAAAYIYWRFLEGSDSPGTHGLLGYNQSGDPESSGKYVAFKHFSRFVRPGAERIDAEFANGFASTGGANQYDTLNSVNVASFIHEGDQELTYILLNMKNSEQVVTLHLPEELNISILQAYRSTELERFLQLADLDVANGMVAITLPRFSLLTLVGSYSLVPEPASIVFLMLGLVAQFGRLRRR